MEKDITFEEALAKLEEVVSHLEEGKLSLDESLARFEEGVMLSRLCNRKLAEAKQKVEKLIEKDGTVSKEPMTI